jgi:hypothetical protein
LELAALLGAALDSFSVSCRTGDGEMVVTAEEVAGWAALRR